MKKIIYCLGLFYLVLIFPNFSQGQTWSAVNSGVNAAVNAMAIYNGELYVSVASNGSFTNELKKWNGSSWSVAGTFNGSSYGPGYPAEIMALAVYNGELYAGGNFADVNGIPDTCIAKWNGTNWSAVPGSWGNPPDHRCGDVLAMAVSNNELYIGGLLCGNQNYCQRWDGWSWTPVFGLGSIVHSLCDYNNVLYAGYDGGMRKLNNGLWSNVGSGGPAGTVRSLAVVNNELYAGGEFLQSYGVGTLINTNCIAKWNGSLWSAVGTGMGGTPINGNLSVNAITGYAGEVYAAGNFTTAGGGTANFIAKWNGSGWSALGSGTNWPANSLIVFNNNLFDGGQFWIAGGIPVNFIAKWHAPSCPSSITAGGPTTFCSGGTVTLNANPGIGFNYQWKLNGAAISGATLSSYSVTAAGNYTCVVSNGCNSTSNIISVTVQSLPSAVVTSAGPTTFCSGGSVVLNAQVAANRSYQWKKNNTNISGATLSSYTATAGGTYKVTVTNTSTGCSKTTTVGTTIIVNANPAATITPQGPTTFCAGGSVVLAGNSGTGLTYKWKKGSNYISGATLINYTATTAGTYRVEVTKSNGCSKTSSGVVVTVPCREDGSAIVQMDFFGEKVFNVTVYPNPSSGDFIFDIQNTVGEKISISIFDVIGKIVFAEETSASQFTIQNFKLSPGIYSAVIVNGEKKKVLRLIKTG